MGAEDLWASVPGQASAVSVLRHAALNPVHAYLLLGPAGSGMRPAARSFAAALLCPEGGCGACGHCARAMAAHHPDMVIASHDGPTWRTLEIRDLTQIAMRRPLEAARTVIILPDANLLTVAAPALLKTLEEPPATTVMVLLADDLPRSLETIRSRCVEVRFDALSDAAVAEVLVSDGVDPARAASIAEGAGGDIARARLLVDDPGFAERIERWRGLPRRLDGTGRSVTTLVAEIEASLALAQEPLAAAHDVELKEFDAEAKELGLRSGGRKELVDHHKREIKAYREGEVRAGLSVLTRVYRDAMAQAVAAGDDAGTTRAMERIDAVGRYLSVIRRNPRPTLSLERLLFDLS